MLYYLKHSTNLSMLWMELVPYLRIQHGMAVKTGQTKNGTLGKPGAGIGISVDWYVLVNHYNLHFTDLYILLVYVVFTIPQSIL